MRAQALAGALLLASFSGTTARAQETPTDLPPVTMTPPSSSQAPGPGANSNQGIGIGAKSNDSKGDGKALEKLNRDLKQKVDEVNPTINAPPLDARSPDTKIGIINIPAVQQQYGKNFGHSAVPYRPPPLVYTAPLGHH